MQRLVYHDDAIPSSDPHKAADQLSPHPAERFPHHDDADIPSSRQPIQVKPQNHYPHPHSPRRENPTKPWRRATICYGCGVWHSRLVGGIGRLD